jgi:hypothetical protein
MTPETLLLSLARVRRRRSVDPRVPFLLEISDRGTQFLVHPLLTEGVSVDAETYYALQTLVRVGYLTQSDEGTYNFTSDGLSYAARLDGTWDGIERRRQERRSSGQQPAGADNRRVDRRLGSLGA